MQVIFVSWKDKLTFMFIYCWKITEIPFGKYQQNTTNCKKKQQTMVIKKIHDSFSSEFSRYKTI